MFKKYMDIENSYRQKHINRFLNDFPELRDCLYIIEEKRDGANISLVFNPDGNYIICTRNRVLKEDEDFYEIKKVLPYYQEIIDFSKKSAYIQGKNFHIYGELLGQNIQKRINYGNDKFFEIFDVGISDEEGNFELMPQKYLYENKILNKYMVPVIGFVKGIDNAINYVPNNFDEIEGIVIKPYEKVYTNVVGKTFYLKHKNPKFEEKQKNKSKKPKFSSEAEKMKSEFDSYVTKNRLFSVFSKEGEIQDQKEIGKYIKLVLEDAKEDFFKDGLIDPWEFDKSELKFIFNSGAKIVEWLKEYL